ncbi:hypothetical protein QQX98_008678 [Neonectria punicea]|uniref:Uncharacterized protein n=1 Tax=Neonectria punicea TaxID=979145 RepID=A0ABR1GUD0_9HYPO
MALTTAGSVLGAIASLATIPTDLLTVDKWPGINTGGFGLSFALLMIPETDNRGDNAGHRCHRVSEITRTLRRSLRLFFTELIVLSTSVYLTLLYGIFYLFFQTLPLVFSEKYAFSDLSQALGLLPLCVSAAVAFTAYVALESVLHKAANQAVNGC